MQTASMAAAGSMLVETARAADKAEAPPGAPAPIPAFAPLHQPKPLPFDPTKLDGLSEKLIRSHWENNYGGSVKALNAVKQKLEQALADRDTPPFLYDDLKREHLMRTGSVVFHELYFGNLGGSGKADAELRRSIGAAFGGFDAWETEFRRVGAGLGGGSGWVVLGYNLHSGQIENYWLADHLHAPAATLPLLVNEMYSALRGYRAGQQRLTCTGRPVQQHALGSENPEPLEDVRVFQR
jgi:Fe-Mn family superoxide dismutase